MLKSLMSLTVTLTYDDAHLPDKVKHLVGDPLNPPFISFWYHPYNYDHVQRFFKRLRKDYQFRYFGVAEYGFKTARPHYHIIFFFNSPVDKLQFTKSVFKQWYYGSQIVIDDTNDDCIGYTLKYCIKIYNNHDPAPKIFLSKRPFIGSGYLTDSTVERLRSVPGDTVDTICGKIRLPRLIRDKVFDDDMKERNHEILLDGLDEQFYRDLKEADEKGISYEELIARRVESFTKSCINQIKKKKL